MSKLAGLILFTYLILLSSIAIAETVSLPADYQNQDLLTATGLNDRFNNVKAAVDDNDTKINVLRTSTCGGSKAIRGYVNGTLDCINITSTGGGTGGGDITAVITNPGSGLIGGQNTGDTTLSLDANVVKTLAVEAMLTKSASNTLNHDRYTTAEAQSSMGALQDTNSLNHDKYTNNDAAGAMGIVSNTNSLNHNRFTGAEAVTAVRNAGFLDNIGETRINAGWVNWVKGNPDYPILYDPNNTSASLFLRTTSLTTNNATAYRFFLNADLPVTQFGVSMELYALEFCYDANANASTGVILSQLEVMVNENIGMNTTGSASKIVVKNITDRTDDNCLTYIILNDASLTNPVPTPYVLTNGSLVTVKIFLRYNAFDPGIVSPKPPTSYPIIISRTSFLLRPVGTGAAAAAALMAKLPPKNIVSSVEFGINDFDESTMPDE